MDSNKNHEESKLKSMIQKMYSAFSMIYQKLNSVLNANTNNYNGKTDLQYFSKMPEQQTFISKLYQSFSSDFARVVNVLFDNNTERNNKLSASKAMNISNGSNSRHSLASNRSQQVNESLFEKALKIIEVNKSLELNSIIQQAGEIKGGTLSKEEISMTERLFKFIEPMQMFANFNGIDSKILTNSLTARGGFKTGAVGPNPENINRSIKDKVTEISKVMDQIRQLQNDIKTTVEKGLAV